MADACEESSSDCSDNISGDNSSFYTENSSSEEDLQCEEPRMSSSSVEKRKSRREKSNSSSKRSAKKKSAKQKKQASNTLAEDQLEELTSWIFSIQKASEIEEIVRQQTRRTRKLCMYFQEPNCHCQRLPHLLCFACIVV